MTSKFFVTAQDMEHVKLHIWELQQLIDQMRKEQNPATGALQRILDRFVKADPNQDRAN